MIFVEGLTHRKTIWGDGVSAHLISDASVAELKDFAQYIRMPDYWYQPIPVPHFELSPWWRRRALKAGAVNCSGDDRQHLYVGALRRFLERHPQLLGEDLARVFLERIGKAAGGDR